MARTEGWVPTEPTVQPKYDKERSLQASQARDAKRQTLAQAVWEALCLPINPTDILRFSEDLYRSGVHDQGLLLVLQPKIEAAG